MLYTKAITEITWENIFEFCNQRTPEGAHLDYKQDFPKNLEKTISAMANTLGGIILLGVAEDEETRPILPLKGIKFQRGLSERVTNIILSNITPPLFPEIQPYRNADDKSKAIVLIRILKAIKRQTLSRTILRSIYAQVIGISRKLLPISIELGGS